MNEFDVVGLYDHNIDSYKKIRTGYLIQDVVGIVHATGTGKSYNGLQLAFDNKDKKIVWVVPSNGIIEHILKIIEENPNLDLNRDFSNLDLRTYQSLCWVSREEISEMEIDMLILDEFHHIGAPVWGSRVNDIIEIHPKIKIFGMTAYTVRDRGTPYERDMALEGGNELFSDKIVSRYDLCDAMLDGVLPKPIYRSCHVNLIGMEQELESLVMKFDASSKEYQEYMAILNSVKKRIADAPSMFDVIKKNVKPGGKYIYFCPPNSLDGTNDIETIKNEAMSWFKQYINEEDIIFYSSTSDMEDHGKSNRNAFYNDVDLEGKDASNKLRVMFAINQYNEGIHAPNVDGVLLGRCTCSDIVFGEQIGRALNVRGNTKEMFDYYMKYSKDELIKLCEERDIVISGDISKEGIIEKLIVPTIIDLVDNYEFIKDLENNLKDRIMERQESGLGTRSVLSISDASFDIDVVNHDLYEMLCELKERLTMSWDKWYKLAEEYFKEHGDLEVPARYITKNGEKLGSWLSGQRKAYKFRYILKESSTFRISLLTDEQVQKLEKIGMIWNVRDNNWMEMYELATEYYIQHGNIDVPRRYTTSNGEKLGSWIVYQRQVYRRMMSKDKWMAGMTPLTDEQIKMLENIGMKWNPFDDNWMEMYEAAQRYFLEHHNLNVTSVFITDDGKKLGSWISEQRKKYRNNSKNKNIKSLSDEKVKLLEKIGMIWYPFDNNWMKMYELAEKYFFEHGDLDVPLRYIENDITLGVWISNQRKAYKNRMILSNERKTTFKPLSDSQVELLEKIGMKWDVLEYDVKWMEMYELARNYFLEHNNLNVKKWFVTEDGKKLGQWLRVQKEAYRYRFVSVEERKSRRRPLTDEQVLMLESIGMIWDVKKNKEDVIMLCEEYGIDVNKNKLVIKSISFKELKAKLLFLNDSGISIMNEEGILHEIFSMCSLNVQMKYGQSLEDLINKYIISFGKGCNS